MGPTPCALCAISDGLYWSDQPLMGRVRGLLFASDISSIKFTTTSMSRGHEIDAFPKSTSWFRPMVTSSYRVAYSQERSILIYKWLRHNNIPLSEHCIGSRVLESRRALQRPSVPHAHQPPQGTRREACNVVTCRCYSMESSLHIVASRVHLEADNTALFDRSQGHN
jgi:hypothetical protein